MTGSVAQALSYAAAWLAFSLCSGYVASRMPSRSLGRSTGGRTGSASRRPGEMYRWLRIDRWKDRLPEAGDFFAGGGSKARLPDRSDGSLRMYVVETRRAEMVHWAGVAFGWTFFAWAPPLHAAINAAVGTIGHLPFILVQRYNRRRVEALLGRRAARTVEVRPSRPAV